MNLFAALMSGQFSKGGESPMGDKPGRLSLQNANMVQVGNILKSKDNSPALRVPVGDGKELNIGFVRQGNRFNAVLVDDAGSPVASPTGSMFKDITDPMQGLTEDELAKTLHGMHTSRFGKPAYQNMMKAAQESGRVVSMPPVAAAIAKPKK